MLKMLTPTYILIEYSSNYFKISGSLWFSCKDETTYFNADVVIIIILNLSNIRLNY